jgi:uncharacterized protein (TIGR03086 family)
MSETQNPTATSADPTTAPDPTIAPDPRPLFARAVSTATDVIAGIRPEQFDNPSPCAEMNVGKLVEHLIGVAGRVAAMGRGENPMSVPGFADDLPDTELLPEWRAASADACRAWEDDRTLERTIVLPWATDSGARALMGYVNEVTVHTWDIATATQQHPVWDEQAVTSSLALMHEWLPADRAELFEAVRKKMGAAAGPNDAFAPVVPVPEDAAPIDRLVAWNGRRP